MLYRATIRNLPFQQAQAIYRILVNLQDYEPFHGSEGMSWNGLIPGIRDEAPERTVEIRPMPTHNEVADELGRNNSVFLLWNNSREEHGESASLVCVYGSRQAAEAHIGREADFGDISEDQDPDEIAEQVEAVYDNFIIEERTVIG